MEWPCEADELERFMKVAEAAGAQEDRVGACMRMMEAAAMTAAAVTGVSGMPYEKAEAQWERVMERSRQFFTLWHAWYACLRAEGEAVADRVEPVA